MMLQAIEATFMPWGELVGILQNQDTKEYLDTLDGFLNDLFSSWLVHWDRAVVLNGEGSVLQIMQSNGPCTLPV